MSVADIIVLVAAAAAIGGPGLVLLRAAAGAHRRAGGRGAAGRGDGAGRVQPGRDPGRARACRWRSCSTGRSPVTAPPGWSSLTWP